MICFVLGSGPSLNRETAARLEGRYVIAVNNSYQRAPFADLFFNDINWFRKHRTDVERLPGRAFSTSYKAAQECAKVRYVSAEIRAEFPAPGIIRDGKCSGQKAIGLAVSLGARRIVLLGFDMREVDGRTHFHDEYRNDASRYSDYFIPAFAGWRESAARIGVSIVNATPNSALTEFPVTSLDLELAEIAA